jgi:hypothetical protein
MRHRNQLGSIAPLRTISAALVLGIGLVAVAPSLYGGGGDEGVDVMPRTRGSPTPTPTPSPTSAGPSSTTSSSTPFVGRSPYRPVNGYLTVHGSGAPLAGNGVPFASGLVVERHGKADVYFGLPGTEPFHGKTALDILTKGNRRFLYGEVQGQPGMLVPTHVYLNGRFEYEDVDPSTHQVVELVTRGHVAGTLAILVGQRSTHDGSVGASFTTVDSVSYENVPYGVVDLASRRAAWQAALQGTGKDVGLALYATVPAGTDELWAAFNVDDARAVYDVEVNLAH